jgi:hypothetical protein
MSRIILLDSGSLGLITNPSASEENRECNAWVQTRLREGDRVMVPAISDYEVRRELLRAEKTKGLARLDGLKECSGLHSVDFGSFTPGGRLNSGPKQDGRENPRPLTQLSMSTSSYVRSCGAHDCAH